MCAQISSIKEFIFFSSFLYKRQKKTKQLLRSESEPVPSAFAAQRHTAHKNCPYESFYICLTCLDVVPRIRAAVSRHILKRKVVHPCRRSRLWFLTLWPPLRHLHGITHSIVLSEINFETWNFEEEQDGVPMREPKFTWAVQLCWSQSNILACPLVRASGTAGVVLSKVVQQDIPKINTDGGTCVAIGKRKKKRTITLRRGLRVQTRTLLLRRIDWRQLGAAAHSLI